MLLWVFLYYVPLPEMSHMYFNLYIPTTTEVFQQAEALGLQLCPAVGPQYRLRYADQPMNEWFWVGMKPIADSYGNPNMFNLGRNARGLWLNSYWTNSSYKWSPGIEFVFSFRKSSIDTKFPGIFDRIFKR